jgi:alanine racemase
MRPIQALISQSALQHNLVVVKQRAPHAKIMAVLKANAYGHGLINVAHALKTADGFAVIGLNEAIALRDAGFNQTIMLLEGLFQAEELVQAASLALDIVVHNQMQIKMLEQASLVHKINIHLKMNTGMNRLGFTTDEYSAVFSRLRACDNVNNITLMTHFATADLDLGIALPLTRFEQARQDIDQAQALAISLANSASILRYPQAHADWVRPGIMLYGASPVGATLASSFGLKAAMTLNTELISVQMLAVGDSVGYGNLFTATKPTRIGIVACGYADGYPRNAPNGTPIAVHGKITQTIGRVSMDMLYADLTDIPLASIGSPVEMWGSQVPVDSVAEMCGTTGYELLCAVAPRVHMKVVD